MSNANTATEKTATAKLPDAMTIESATKIAKEKGAQFFAEVGAAGGFGNPKSLGDGVSFDLKGLKGDARAAVEQIFATYTK